MSLSQSKQPIEVNGASRATIMMKTTIWENRGLHVFYKLFQTKIIPFSLIGNSTYCIRMFTPADTICPFVVEQWLKPKSTGIGKRPNSSSFINTYAEEKKVTISKRSKKYPSELRWQVIICPWKLLPCKPFQAALGSRICTGLG